MSKITRRTVAITVCETWTIVWTGDVRADDKLQPQATIILPDQPETQEELEATLQATVSDAEPS
jgi:hypothetical protein